MDYIDCSEEAYHKCTGRQRWEDDVACTLQDQDELQADFRGTVFEQGLVTLRFRV